MYRAVIEHPQWIPRETQKKLDLRAGHDKGRIYRVYPTGTRPRTIPRLDRLNTAGLVAALDSPSGWQRDMAQQMLLWRDDRKAAPLLEKLAVSSRPLARLHALYTLNGLDCLTPAVLIKALSDAHPGVRRHAVKLCETRLAASIDLGKALLARVEDADVTVRLQLAFTLGEWKDDRAGRALGQLLRRGEGDRFLHAAAMSSLNRDNLDAVLQAVLESGSPPASLIEALMRQASAMGNDRAIVTLMERIASVPKGETPGWRLPVLAGLLDGLEERGSSLARLSKEGGKDVQAAVARLAGLFAFARKNAVEAGSETERIHCLPLLGRGVDRFKEDRDLLASLLRPQTPEAVQSGAASALARLGGAEVPALLVHGWKGYSPRLRRRCSMLCCSVRRGCRRCSARWRKRSSCRWNWTPFAGSGCWQTAIRRFASGRPRCWRTLCRPIVKR